jgi:hypothetical protein
MATGEILVPSYGYCNINPKGTYGGTSMTRAQLAAEALGARLKLQKDRPTTDIRPSDAIQRVDADDLGLVGWGLELVIAAKDPQPAIAEALRYLHELGCDDVCITKVTLRAPPRQATMQSGTQPA